MQAQKMAAAREESLWHFLQALPTTFEMQIVYAILVSGLLGLFFCYAVKWMRKEIVGSLWAYLFHDNVRGTLLSFTLTVGIGVAGIASGMFEEGNGEFIGWWKTLVLAFGNGYFWDSVANKGKSRTP